MWKYLKRDILIALFVCGSVILNAQDKTKGFYKDLFIDGGMSLTSRSDLPAARFLGLSADSFMCTPKAFGAKTYHSATDSLMQRQVYGGSPIDENGILLYPDGSPRFRMVYTNGGKAGYHGFSVGEQGRKHINDYIRNGGSYVGTCAGAYLACKAYISKKGSKLEKLDRYYGIWPGLATSTGLVKSSTTVSLEKRSPLLRYADFGHDMKIDSVRHNGGGYAVVDSLFPKGTEILARYYTVGRKMKKDIHNQPVIWAYKEDDNSGRMVMCGSHPEAIETGERLDLMAAMMQYAMDGNGMPKLKGKLEMGKERKMYCCSHDNNPDFTAIGDKQYHHFALDVPKDVDTLTIILKPKPGYVDYDLFLLANPEKFAYLGEAKYKNTALGCDKKLIITQPKEGKWYLSVFCDTTVETMVTEYGTQYTGHLDVLNGVPYSIEASYNE